MGDGDLGLGIGTVVGVVEGAAMVGCSVGLGAWVAVSEGRTVGEGGVVGVGVEEGTVVGVAEGSRVAVAVAVAVDVAVAVAGNGVTETVGMMVAVGVALAGVEVCPGVECDAQAAQRREKTISVARRIALPGEAPERHYRF